MGAIGVILNRSFARGDRSSTSHIELSVVDRSPDRPVLHRRKPCERLERTQRELERTTRPPSRCPFGLRGTGECDRPNAMMLGQPASRASLAVIRLRWSVSDRGEGMCSLLRRERRAICTRQLFVKTVATERCEVQIRLR